MSDSIYRNFNSWNPNKRPDSPSPASAYNDGPAIYGPRAPAEGRVIQSQRGWMEVNKGQLPKLGVTAKVASRPDIPHFLKPFSVYFIDPDRRAKTSRPADSTKATH